MSTVRCLIGSAALTSALIGAGCTTVAPPHAGQMARGGGCCCEGMSMGHAEKPAAASRGMSMPPMKGAGLLEPGDKSGAGPTCESCGNMDGCCCAGKMKS